MQGPYGQPPPGGYGMPPPPQGYGMPAPPGPAGYGMAPPSVHPCAIISLIAGIVVCVPGATLAAIICGFVARSAINREPARYSGSGMALAGIILGFVHVAFGILYLIFVVMLGVIGAAANS